MMRDVYEGTPWSNTDQGCSKLEQYYEIASRVTTLLVLLSRQPLLCSRNGGSDLESAMKLEDLQKPISEMSEQELLERLRQIRHNRFVERPAAKKREADASAQEERKSGKKLNSKLDKMIASMPPEQRAALLAQLTQQLGGASEPEGNTTGQVGTGGEVP